MDRFMQQVSQLPTRFLDTSLCEDDELLPEMNGGYDDSPWARPLWKPWKAEGEFSSLSPSYTALPARFPPLYERLAVRYRWLELCVPDLVVLYGNSGRVPLESVARRIGALSTFGERLLSRGMLPLGSDVGGTFDPVCFDSRHLLRDGDCPVIRVNHEAVLSDNPEAPWQTWAIAESFRALLEAGIERMSEMRED